jgi:hypothetical protein
MFCKTLVSCSLVGYVGTVVSVRGLLELPICVMLSIQQSRVGSRTYHMMGSGMASLLIGRRVIATWITPIAR